MVNTTSQRGLHGWSASSHTLSSESGRFLISVERSLTRSLIRHSPPGTRPLSRWSLSLRPCGPLELSEWSLYVCNTCSKPFRTGYVLELSHEDVSRLDELISLVKTLMPGLPWTHPAVDDLLLWTCQRLATEFPLALCFECLDPVPLCEDRFSHADPQGQLFLVA